MLGSGADGGSGKELMMFAGGADGVSEGVRLSQGSSDSTFIVLIFFFLLSSFIFLLGRDRSNSAGRKYERNISRVFHHQINASSLIFNHFFKIYLLTHCPLPTNICS